MLILHGAVLAGGGRHCAGPRGRAECCVLCGGVGPRCRMNLEVDEKVLLSVAADAVGRLLGG